MPNMAPSLFDFFEVISVSSKFFRVASLDFLITTEKRFVQQDCSLKIADGY